MIFSNITYIRTWSGFLVDREIRSHVAPGDDPLVVLLGQDGSDEWDDGGSVWGDVDDVSARRLISLLSLSNG